ncbi:MAG: AraC family transcriptional regulator [Alphaproteobacteria bacterium]|nr:MAG: AraC family transcriptional regulator [Alphaproteobacteria bacterium]
MERYIIAPTFVHDAMEQLPRHGVSPHDVLARAGLPDPVEAPITSEMFGRLWQSISEALDDEFFGMGDRPMRLGAFEHLCHAVLQARTLEQAMQRTIGFLRCVLDNPHGELRVQDGEARIVLHDPSGPRSAFAYRTYWLYLLGVGSWLVERQIPLRRFTFACPAPRHLEAYGHVFGAPAEYDAQRTELIFNATYLKWPVVRSGKHIAAFLRNAPGNLVVRYRQEEGLGKKIRARLEEIPPVDWPRIEDLAAELRMSSAKLRRRLAAEGRSIGEIKDEIRQRRARVLLADPTLTVADVASALGYSEPSAFHRAHRKWTGRTPRG